MSDTLALKYRPRTFEDIVGNEIVAKILKNAVVQNKIPQAMFFVGRRGSGKTSLSRIVSRALVCENLQEDGEPCNQCQSCLDVLDGRHPDVIELDAASENSVQGIRDLIKTLYYLPTSAKVKVVVLDEVHSLSTQAANAFLKTLEEPPEHVRFILCTTEGHKVLETIRSRCLTFHFKDIQVKDIAKRLSWVAQQEGINIDLKALEFIAKYSNGGMRDALMLLEQASFMKRDINETIKSSDIMDIVGFVSLRDIQQLMISLKEEDTKYILEWIEENKFAPQDIILSAINFLETVVFIKQGVSPGSFVAKDQIPGIMSISSSLTFNDVVLIFDELRSILYDLRNLSMVNTFTLFKLRLLQLHLKIHQGTVGPLPKAIKQVMQESPFQKLKKDFDLIRIPLESLLATS